MTVKAMSKEQAEDLDTENFNNKGNVKKKKKGGLCGRLFFFVCLFVLGFFFF